MTYNSFSCFNEDSKDIINRVMMSRNEDGLTFVEQCCFILFYKKDERFLLQVLRDVPNIAKFLYITND